MWKIYATSFFTNSMVLAHGNDNNIELVNLSTNDIMATIVPVGQVTILLFHQTMTYSFIPPLMVVSTSSNWKH